MFEMSPTCANTSMQSLPSLANNCTNNVLLHSAPEFIQSLFKPVQIIDASLVFKLLHDAPKLAGLGSVRGYLAATDQ